MVLAGREPELPRAGPGAAVPEARGRSRSRGATAHRSVWSGGDVRGAVGLDRPTRRSKSGQFIGDSP